MPSSRKPADLSRKDVSMRVRLWIVAVGASLFAGLVVPSTLFAQSDAPDTRNEEPASDTDVEVEPDPLLEQGSFEIGGDLALLWSVDTNVPEDDDRVTNRSYYGDIGAHVGYMFQDKLEGRLHAGWLRIDSGIRQDTLQRTDALVLAFQMMFYGPIDDQLALFVGPGVGGYLGQTNRDVEVGGESLDAQNATNGLLGQLLTGVLIELGPYVAIRTGLRLDGLVGRELPSEGTDLQRRNTQNVKLLGIFEVSGKL